MKELEYARTERLQLEDLSLYIIIQIQSMDRCIFLKVNR